MDYKNDERYWNIKLLNKWFAISSILFLISIAWMFLDDNDDEFKTYQRNFRNLAAEITQSKLNDELNKVVDSRLEYEEKYNQEKDIFQSYNNELDSLNKLLEETNGVFHKVNMDYLFFKAEVDVLKYLYEKNIAEDSHHSDKHEDAHEDVHENHHESHAVSKSKTEYENSLVELNVLKLHKEKVEKSISDIKGADFGSQQTAGIRSYEKMAISLVSELEKELFDNIWNQ